jgi:hypothetical protein
MSIENKEALPLPPVYKVDISEGWDKESQVALLLKGIKKLPCYRPELLYSGFNGDQIGKSTGSTEGEHVVFCAPEEAIGNDDRISSGDPFVFAIEHSNSAIAIYDPSKLKFADPQHKGNEGYIANDPEALIAIVNF